MRGIAILILCFIVGFYGMALVMDEPKMLVVKAYVLYSGVIISLILLIADEIVNKD